MSRIHSAVAAIVAAITPGAVALAEEPAPPPAETYRAGEEGPAKALVRGRAASGMSSTLAEEDGPASAGARAMTGPAAGAPSRAEEGSGATAAAATSRPSAMRSSRTR